MSVYVHRTLCQHIGIYIVQGSQYKINFVDGGHRNSRLSNGIGQRASGAYIKLQPNIKLKLSSHTYKHLDCLYKMFYICLITTTDQNICTQYICMDILHYN